MRFVRSYPIRFSHCDFAGMAFYPQYFVLFNDHVEDWFDQGLDESFAALHGAQGLAVPTARIECEFAAPSRIGDRLDFWLEIERLGESSVTLSRGADCGGRTRVAMRQVLVCIDQSTGRPRTWPDRLRGRMQAFVASSPSPSPSAPSPSAPSPSAPDPDARP